ncbi:MAG: insulinase family protein [Deltaproteobacteria bacterium]|nr:insulinase family protein [Deltaproteobacteria bacterium]
MRTRVWALLAPVVLWASAAAADDTPKIKHEVFTLPSGLQVVLVPDRSVPLVAVDVWYHVGSGDEVPGKSGFAHLFEHMMFQGAKHIGEDVHFEILKKAGASQINGTTNTDRTNYFEQVPSHHLETALRLESDRMGWLLDTLNQKSLDNQREVVRNERRQRYDNVPYGKERFAISQMLYPEGHPYRYMTIGRHEDLQAASVDDVQSFFKQWYVPSNATLCLAGDFDPKQAKAALNKWFGTLPKAPAPQHRPVATPQLSAAQEQTVSDPLARLERIHLAWHSPAMYKPGDADLDLAAHILGHGGTGRLYKRLVHQDQSAQSVAVYQGSQQLSSVFHVIVDLKPGASRDAVLKVIDEELARLAKEPPSAAERNRAVLDVESAFVWGLEGLMNRCEVLQAYQHYLGKTDALAQDLQRYRGATPQSIAAAVASTLMPDRRAAVFSVPAKAATPGQGGGR